MKLVLTKKAPAGAAVIAAALLVFAAGCEDDEDDNTLVVDGGGGGGGSDASRDGGADASTGGGNVDAAVGANQARVRVVHASPDAPAVDLYVQGNATPVARNLAYGQATPYLEVPAGNYVFEIRAAGTAATSAAAFTTPMLTVPAGAKITAVAAGFLASMNADDKFRVLVLPEGFGAVAANTVRARIVHAGPDAPTVAVDVGADGMPEIPELRRFADTGVPGVELPAGMALRVAIWAGMPLARVTTFTTPALPAGAELFVIATGSLAKAPRDPAGFGLLAVGPMGVVGLIKQDPTVYALHASPDAPAVDIFAGAAEVVSNLGFGAISPPVQVSPNNGVTLDFFATAAGTTRPAGMAAASAMTPALMAGERYLAIATGFLSPATGKPAFQLIAVRDELETDPAKAKIRVIHASPDAPNVDVGVVSGSTFTAPDPLKNLPFKGVTMAGGGIPLDPGMITVGVAAAGTNMPVARFDLTLTAGLRAYVVAAGALAPATGQQSFRLLVVNAGASPWSVASVPPKQ